jgi:hypothetical protein
MSHNMRSPLCADTCHNCPPLCACRSSPCAALQPTQAASGMSAASVCPAQPLSVPAVLMTGVTLSQAVSPVAQTASSVYGTFAGQLMRCPSYPALQQASGGLAGACCTSQHASCTACILLTDVIVRTYMPLYRPH